MNTFKTTSCSTLFLLLALLASVSSIPTRIEGPFFDEFQTKESLNVIAHNVTVDWNVEYLGRKALKVKFTDEYENVSGIQGNGYAEIPAINFYEGTIEVDIAAERNRHASDESRSFAGIAFHKLTKDHYEAVYMKLANGMLSIPPPNEEDVNKAVQYISPPQWVFYELEKFFPGKHQTRAKIAEKRWHHFKLIVKDHTVTVYIDGERVMNKVDLMGSDVAGPIALFVDAATDAYFSNLIIQHD